MHDISSDSALVAVTQSRYWREEDAALVLSAWSHSGLSLNAFARQCGINVSRLNRWRQRLGDQPLPSFHPVRVLTRVPDDKGKLELVLSNGRRIVVRPGFDADTLERLVQVVDSWRC